VSEQKKFEKIQRDERYGTGSVSDLSLDQQAFWPMLRSLTLPVP